MIANQRLIDAMAEAIAARGTGSAGSAADHFQSAFLEAVEQAMSEAFRNGRISSNTSFRDAVRKIIDPGHLLR